MKIGIIMKKMNKKKTSENIGKKMTGKEENGGLSLRFAEQVGKRRIKLEKRRNKLAKGKMVESVGNRGNWRNKLEKGKK